jgi:hypothetical protein
MDAGTAEADHFVDRAAAAPMLVRSPPSGQRTYQHYEPDFLIVLISVSLDWASRPTAGLKRVHFPAPLTGAGPLANHGSFGRVNTQVVIARLRAQQPTRYFGANYRNSNWSLVQNCRVEKGSAGRWRRISQKNLQKPQWIASSALPSASTQRFTLV